MNSDEIRGHIQAIVDRILRQKGLDPVLLTKETRFLGGHVPIDSLDLAVLLTELEKVTGVDPFKYGFRNFLTVDELAGLYMDGKK
jgi:acyl carrier protein